MTEKEKSTRRKIFCNFAHDRFLSLLVKINKNIAAKNNVLHCRKIIVIIHKIEPCKRNFLPCSRVDPCALVLFAAAAEKIAVLYVKRESCDTVHRIYSFDSFVEHFGRNICCKDRKIAELTRVCAHIFLHCY